MRRLTWVFASIVLVGSGCVTSTSSLYLPDDPAVVFEASLLGDFTLPPQEPAKPATKAKPRIAASSPPTTRGLIIFQTPLGLHSIPFGSMQEPDLPPVQERFLRVERKTPDSKIYLLSTYRVPLPVKPDKHPEPARDGEVMIESRLIRLGEGLYCGVEGEGPDRRGTLIYKLERSGGEWRFRMLEPSFFRKNPGALSCEIGKGFWKKDLVMLKASTPELREFLRSHAGDPAVWTKPEPLRRRSPEPKVTGSPQSPK